MTHRQGTSGSGLWLWLGCGGGGGAGEWVGGGAGRTASWTSSSVVYVPAIMQRQFPTVLCPRFSSSTVVGYSCAETGTHSANCEADRRDSSGAVLGPFLDRCEVRGVKVVDISVVAQMQFPLTTEILHLQFIDKMFDAYCAGPASSRVQSWRRQSSSHSCCPFSMDTVIAMPVVVQRQLPLVQTSENCEGPAVAVHLNVVDVPVVQVHLGRLFVDKVVDMPLVCDDRVLRTVNVPQIQFIAGFCGRSSSQQRRVRCFQQWRFMAAMKGVFGGSDAFFALLQVVPEWSSSFRSPRWRRVLCHRGLLHNFMLSTCRHGHSD